MSNIMSVRTMVIHNCSGIEIEVDHINGCVTICCNGFAPKFVVTIFSPDEAPPELAPVTYVDPPRDEDENKQEVEYADKHGA